MLPADVLDQIESQVTPSADAAFSSIQVTWQVDSDIQPVSPSDTFILPVGRLYGAFSYNNMEDGVQWTAIWKFQGEIICVESIPWDGGTGGYGYTECEQDEWDEGEYEIQIFVGEVWKISTRFYVLSEVPDTTFTPEITQTP
jgi:hypothetical protein